MCGGKSLVFREFSLTGQKHLVLETCPSHLSQSLYLVTEKNIYIICDFFCWKSIAAVHGNICTHMHISFALLTIYFTCVNKYKVSEI